MAMHTSPTFPATGTEAPILIPLETLSSTKAPIPTVDYSDCFCKKCGAGDNEAELLLCDRLGCDQAYHIYCLRPILVSVPQGLWFCPFCFQKKEPESFPLVQTKIIDFFRIQRCSESTDKSSQENRKKRKRTRSLVALKKNRKLLVFNPSEDPERRDLQMQSLARALEDSGADFSNELTYVPSMAPRSANCSSLEREGMQVLSKQDTNTLNLCKEMMVRGEWPPLMVVKDPVEGYTVVADKSIKDLTIIAEYVGDVDYLKNRERDDGDSIMTLISAADSAKSLVICPDKHSNIARFINGINNYKPQGKKKQNVKCVRFAVNGEARVLLVAMRDIRKGERLYYDYNGYENEYPTKHFI